MAGRHAMASLRSPSGVRRLRLVTAGGAALALALTGCATQRARPVGPTVMALPALGESFAVFQQHDTTCRQYASAQLDAGSPNRAAADGTVAAAAAGAGVGAAAGALLGSASGHAGAGAAVGAGTGLLAGTLLGSAHRSAAARSLQGRYDMFYTQCMIANGDRISAPAVRWVRVVPYPEPVYVPGAVYIAPPPAYAPLPAATPVSPP